MLLCDMLSLHRAVGVLAGILNNTEDEAYFLHRSQNYKNLWDLQSKLLCPRSISGKLECPIHPASLDWLILRDSGYTEGSFFFVIVILCHYCMFV